MVVELSIVATATCMIMFHTYVLLFVVFPVTTATGSATPQPVSQNRRLLDQAAAVFLAEQFLFSADMLHVSSDFYLAAIVLLEKVRKIHISALVVDEMFSHIMLPRISSFEYK